MTANELTAGQVFTTAEPVLAELAHFPGAKVILPATAKVTRK